MANIELIDTARNLINLLDEGAASVLPEEIVDVVTWHSKLAVGSAWIPIPGADVVAGATNIWTMYARINGKINIPVKENILKSLGAGVATNLSSYLTMTGVASSLKFIPGIGTLGGSLIMSASLYAVTIVAGWVYLEALCMLVKKDGTTIKVNDLKAIINKILDNKSLIRQLIKAAKLDYKTQIKD